MNCVTHHDEAVEATVGLLCVKCFSRLRSSLLELPAVATWLEVNIAAAGQAEERVSGSREDPIPLRLDVTDLVGPEAPTPTAALTRDVYDQLTPEALDQAGGPSMLDELRSWAALVEEETGTDWDERTTLTGAVGYLAAHLSWVAGQPWVDEFAAALAKLHRDAHRVAPWRATIIRDREPCETCGVAAIIVRMSEGRTVCEKAAGGCGRVIVWDRNTGRTYAHDKPPRPAKTRITTGEAAALARVQPATVRSWARRDKLRVVGRDSNNRPLYATAEVVKVAQRQDGTRRDIAG